MKELPKIHYCPAASAARCIFQRKERRGLAKKGYLDYCA